MNNNAVPMYGFGGGGKNTSELNFTVKAYSTEEEMLASNPGENTIGIVTDTEITSYDISYLEPESKSEGMIWIYTITNSNFEFNALKENSLRVYPCKAQQYINGEWINREVQMYKDNTWTLLFFAIINIIYPIGSICTATDGVTMLTAPDTSGTWECLIPNAGIWTVLLDGEINNKIVTENFKIYTINDFVLYNNGVWNCEYIIKAYYNGLATFNGSNIKLTTNGTNGSCVYIGVRVNLSGVKAITAHYDSFSVSGTGDNIPNKIGIAVTNSDTPHVFVGWNGTDTIASIRIDNYVNNADVTLDISSANISGYKYIWFSVYGTYGRYSTAVVSKFNFST